MTLNAVTVIDPETGWVEIAEQKDDSSTMTSKSLNNCWLRRHPCPNEIIYDNGPELKKDFKESCRTCGIEQKPASVKNPQSNSMIEQTHQVIGNMSLTFELAEHEFNPNDHWSDLLASVAWAMHSAHHAVLQATPGQLMFSCNMLLNVKHNTNWDALEKCHQTLIDLSCQTENCHCMENW